MIAESPKVEKAELANFEKTELPKSVIAELPKVEKAQAPMMALDVLLSESGLVMVNTEKIETPTETTPPKKRLGRPRRKPQPNNATDSPLVMIETNGKNE